MYADINVFNRSTGLSSELRVLSDAGPLYISTKDLAQSFTSKLYENSDRKKLVIYISGSKIKISGNSSYIIIDDEAYQMPLEAIVELDDIYIPAKYFFDILKRTILPGINFDTKKELLEIDVIRFNITDIKIDVKSNGTIIRMPTKKTFFEGNISSFINKHGWYYLTIAGGVIDTVSINAATPRGVVRQIESDQIGKTAQVAFKLGTNVISHDLSQSRDPNEIIINLRTPLGKLNDHIQDVKARWLLDTVVLDAGHGGKDPGAVGKYGTKEKDVVLDITKRAGRLLEKSGIKVVYTRDEDVFVPLLDRTKIANDANGKLFVSIHTNANKNRKVQGFETFC